jgi:putative two-component system response regulator
MSIQNKGEILVVDDDQRMLDIIGEFLGQEGYTLTFAHSGEDALEKLDQDWPDVILADLKMTGMGGIELVKRIRQRQEGKLTTVIVISGNLKGGALLEVLRAGADETIEKPFKIDELKMRVRNALKHKRLIDELDNAESILFSVARMVEARDRLTGDHCGRLQRYAAALGAALELSPDDIEILRRGAILHDIGKIGIPDDILNAPRKLTADEWTLMKQHPLIGEDLCKPLQIMRAPLVIVRSHHERWNGTGYPDGLKGEKIPFLARIFQVVDVFDALTSKRPYKEAWPISTAVQQLQEEESQGWYEPGLVETWIRTLERDPELRKLVPGP